MYVVRHDKGIKTCFVTGDKKTVRTTYADRTECVEEFSKDTSDLVARKWRVKKEIGEGKWEYEVGEDSTLSPPTSSGLIVAASLNPVFVSRDSKLFFEWRIRNIPYPIETYELSVDDEKQQIVLRTTNKKYFKRWDIPMLRRNEIKLDASNLRCTHGSNTLVVTYSKPESIQLVEARGREEMKALKAQEDGEVGGCKNQ